MGNTPIKKYNKNKSFIAYKNFNILYFINKYNDLNIKLNNIEYFIHYHKTSNIYSKKIIYQFKEIMPNLKKIIIKNNSLKYISNNDIVISYNF